MKKEVGLWIDHRHATLVTLHDEEEVVQHIESDVEKRIRFSGASHSSNETAPNDDYAEDKRDRRINEQITRYYDEIINHLRDAAGVLIMGPGPAKIEFQKYMEGQKLGDLIAGIEPADKLTDGQIAAKVRAFFPVHQHNH